MIDHHSSEGQDKTYSGLDRFGQRATPTRFHKANPCPVCGTSTKGCSRKEDGLHFCRGAKDASKGSIVSGFVCLGVDATGEFWLFRRQEERHARGRPRSAQAQREQDLPPAPNWTERHAEARKRMTAARLTAFANKLGVPAAALAALEPGVEFHGPAEQLQDVIVFPMRDGAGQLCGLHGRYPGEEKKAVAGSRLGVFTSAGWRDTEDALYVPEGASDTGSLAALGLPALGRPSAKAGGQVLADLLAGTGREIVVLGELDPNTDNGEWPGRDGAVATATRLAAALRRPVSWAFPPGRAKDVRDWFAAQGLTASSQADDCHAAGERFEAGLKKLAVNPPEGGEEDPDLILSEEDIPTLADARAAGAVKRWLWQNWLQADVLNGLAGDFGAGKTRFVAELFRRIRAGEPWPDGAAMTLPFDSRFLCVPADYQHSELSDLAENYGFPEECVFINAMKDNPDGVSLFDSPMAMKCLEKRIAILRPAFVVVDPMTSITTEKGAHSYAEVGTALYGPLQRLARKYATAFLILIHLNRQGTTYGRHATGKFRCELTLAKVETPEGNRYRLEISKTNSNTPPPLGATQHGDRWAFDTSPPDKDVGGGRRGPKPTVVDDEAVRFLREFLGSAERKQVEVIGAWVNAGHAKKTLFAAATRMIESGELLKAEVDSPKGRTKLKTWQLAPPAGERNGQQSGQAETQS
jgi:hypothetical protein